MGLGAGRLYTMCVVLARSNSDIVMWVACCVMSGGTCVGALDPCPGLSSFPKGLLVRSLGHLLQWLPDCTGCVGSYETSIPMHNGMPLC